MDYADDDFVSDGPLWFVVAEAATVIAPEGHRDLVDRRAGVFCNGVVDGKRCLLIFTDEDLAARYAQKFPGCVPLGCNNAPALIELLEQYYPNDFDSVILDLNETIPLTNKRKPIPEFVAALRRRD